MNPLSRQIVDYIILMGFSFSKFDDKFTVEIAGEEYTIQRLGLRHWRCVHYGFMTEFKSQYEVIKWLDSRWSFSEEM